MSTYILAVTGASGTPYALRLLDFLLEKQMTVHLVISQGAQLVAEQETGFSWTEIMDRKHYLPMNRDKLMVWNDEDFTAPIASGSFLNDGMMIVPTSMSTLAAIACGLSANLIQRAADVAIKEKRPLVLLPRETPLSSIHLKNMLELSLLGVHIVPPIPAFYTQPKTVEDIVDFSVGRVLDTMKIQHNLYPGWKGKKNISKEREMYV